MLVGVSKARFRNLKICVVYMDWSRTYCGQFCIKLCNNNITISIIATHSQQSLNIVTIATTDKTVKANIIIMLIVPTSDKNIKAKVFLLNPCRINSLSHSSI